MSVPRSGLAVGKYELIAEWAGALGHSGALRKLADREVLRTVMELAW
ncbi:hypothetical protein SAMN03159496_05215 [Rhizobium sp. NFR07]|nr:hypothetical protein [Rhizobium sp. NFR07]SFB56960.1 hypothetical protein SAMN03159496_05215 [Rhizobium sp. NFR07]